MSAGPRGDSWSQQLDELAAEGLRRRLRTIDSAQSASVLIEGCVLHCMCSNNYLGLANHPRVIEAVKIALDRWGWGAGASRLVSGHMTPHQHLEDRIARFKGTQAALVCPTGYQANLAAIRAIAAEGDIVFCDRLNHASIIDAARGSGATFRVFPHRDYDKLEQLLQKSNEFRRRVIVTDSVFSMDGDATDLPRLVQLKQHHNALLCIDEAHATGVFGRSGRGLAEMMNVEEHIDVVIGTLSKALGGIGGFIAASREIIDWIINTAGPFIYTTAIPPAACAAAMAAIDIIESDEGLERRTRLLENAAILRAALRDERRLDIGQSTTQIVPLIVGSSEGALRLSQALETAGFLIPAIRPPTVPRGAARLRISLCADHPPGLCKSLLAAIDRAGFSISEHHKDR